jgi:hypothetical protein
MDEERVVIETVGGPVGPMRVTAFPPSAPPWKRIFSGRSPDCISTASEPPAASLAANASLSTNPPGVNGLKGEPQVASLEPAKYTFPVLFPPAPPGCGLNEYTIP